jgi:putative FmdB family regulatory protein
MPLYDYKCTNCATIREIRHGFNESHDEPCPQCGAALQRVFNPAPIVFKGTGFYVTDSRPKDSSSSSAPEKKSEPAAPSSSTSESAA